MGGINSDRAGFADYVPDLANAWPGAQLQPDELVPALVGAIGDLDQSVIVWSDEGVLFVNSAVARLSGYSIDELLQFPSFHEIVVPEQRERVAKDRGLPGIHLMTIRRKDGRLVDLEVRRHRIELGSRGNVMVSVGRDITALAESERRLQYAASHDALTGLPNQTRLQAELGEALSEPGALLIFDLEGVKDVNETFGRPAGDGVLAEAASRLHARLQDRGFLARIGGSEFAVVLRRADEREAQGIAAQISLAMEVAFPLDGHAVALRAVSGIALFPRDGRDPVGILRAADAAVHQARQRRQGWATFDQRRDAERSDRLALMEDLRVAVREQQFFLHYQPILNLKAQRIVGAEALARWSHPTRGLIPPSVFVPLAARSGLGRALTDWVLARALETYRSLHREGRVLPVLVNVAASDLVDPAFLEQVEAFARSHRLSEKWLKVEITESELVADRARVLPVLRRLRQLGVIIAIDDYGTGYSSLSYLHRLPIDAVKLDRSFALGLAQPRIEAIVRSTVALGHQLGYLVGAEGVEDDGVLARVAEIGCDFAQGYGIARPMPAERLTKWLAVHDGRAEVPSKPLSGAGRSGVPRDGRARAG